MLLPLRKLLFYFLILVTSLECFIAQDTSSLLAINFDPPSSGLFLKSFHSIKNVTHHQYLFYPYNPTNSYFRASFADFQISYPLENLSRINPNNKFFPVYVVSDAIIVRGYMVSKTISIAHPLFQSLYHLDIHQKRPFFTTSSEFSLQQLCIETILIKNNKALRTSCVVNITTNSNATRACLASVNLPKVWWSQKRKEWGDKGSDDTSIKDHNVDIFFTVHTSQIPKSCYEDRNNDRTQKNHYNEENTHEKIELNPSVRFVKLGRVEFSKEDIYDEKELSEDEDTDEFPNIDNTTISDTNVSNITINESSTVSNATSGNVNGSTNRLNDSYEDSDEVYVEIPDKEVHGTFKVTVKASRLLELFKLRIKSGKGLKITGLELKDGWKNNNKLEDFKSNTFTEFIFEKLPSNSIDEASSDTSSKTVVCDLVLAVQQMAGPTEKLDVEWLHVNATTNTSKRKEFFIKIKDSDMVNSIFAITQVKDIINVAPITNTPQYYDLFVYALSNNHVLDVTNQSHCFSHDESVVKVFRNCKALFVDGSEKKGSSKAKIKVIYGSFVTVLRVGVWVLELPLKVEVGDDRLNVVAGWKVPLTNDPIFWYRSRKYKKSTSSSMSCQMKFQTTTVEVYAKVIAHDESEREELITDKQQNDSQNNHVDNHDATKNTFSKRYSNHHSIPDKKLNDKIQASFSKRDVYKSGKSMESAKNFVNFTSYEDGDDDYFYDYSDMYYYDDEDEEDDASLYEGEYLQNIIFGGDGTGAKEKESFFFKKNHLDNGKTLHKQPQNNQQYNHKDAKQFNSHHHLINHQSLSNQKISYLLHRKTMVKVTHLLSHLINTSNYPYTVTSNLHPDIVLLEATRPGKFEVLVKSPLKGIVGRKEVRATTKKVTMDSVSGQVVGGLKVKVEESKDFEGVYVANVIVETKLSQKDQKGKLDVWLNYNDDTRSPLALCPPSAFSVSIESLDESVVTVDNKDDIYLKMDKHNGNSKVENKRNHQYALTADSFNHNYYRLQHPLSSTRIIGHSNGSGQLISMALSSSPDCFGTRQRRLVTGHAKVNVVMDSSDAQTMSDEEYMVLPFKVLEFEHITPNVPKSKGIKGKKAGWREAMEPHPAYQYHSQKFMDHFVNQPSRQYVGKQPVFTTSNTLYTSMYILLALSTFLLLLLILLLATKHFSGKHKVLEIFSPKNTSIREVEDWVWIDKKTLERNQVNTGCPRALMSPDEFHRAREGGSSRLSSATDYTSSVSCLSSSRAGIYKGSECSVLIGPVNNISQLNKDDSGLLGGSEGRGNGSVRNKRNIDSSSDHNVYKSNNNGNYDQVIHPKFNADENKLVHKNVDLMMISGDGTDAEMPEVKPQLDEDFEEVDANNNFKSSTFTRSKSTKNNQSGLIDINTENNFRFDQNAKTNEVTDTLIEVGEYEAKLDVKVTEAIRMNKEKSERRRSDTKNNKTSSHKVKKNHSDKRHRIKSLQNSQFENLSQEDNLMLKRDLLNFSQQALQEEIAKCHKANRHDHHRRNRHRKKSQNENLEDEVFFNKNEERLLQQSEEQLYKQNKNKIQHSSQTQPQNKSNSEKKKKTSRSKIEKQEEIDGEDELGLLKHRWDENEMGVTYEAIVKYFDDLKETVA